MKEKTPGLDRPLPTHAIFYSITSPYGTSIKGVGPELLKRATADMQTRYPSVKTYVTLSPIPGFRDWLAEKGVVLPTPLSDPSHITATKYGQILEALQDAQHKTQMEEALLPLLLQYLLYSRKPSVGTPLDPVANFHLRNGAALHQVHFAADTSLKGFKQSLSFMANYLYLPGDAEANQKRYNDRKVVVTSGAMEKLMSRAGTSLLPMVYVDKPKSKL